MRKTLAVIAAAGALLMAAAPAWAHHAFAAEFDAGKPIKFKGTVTKMEWINPHAWIHIDVKGEDGQVTSWMIEAAAPNALLRRGWTKHSLLPGTEILVEGYPGERRSESRQRQRDYIHGRKEVVRGFLRRRSRRGPWNHDQIALRGAVLSTLRFLNTSSQMANLPVTA